MKNLIQIISRDGYNYVINLANTVKVKQLTDGCMFITFVNEDKGLYTKTTYDEFLKLTGITNESKYNDPNEEIHV